MNKHPKWRTGYNDNKVFYYYLPYIESVETESYGALIKRVKTEMANEVKKGTFFRGIPNGRHIITGW